MFGVLYWTISPPLYASEAPSFISLYRSKALLAYARQHTLSEDISIAQAPDWPFSSCSPPHLVH